MQFQPVEWRVNMGINLNVNSLFLVLVPYLKTGFLTRRVLSHPYLHFSLVKLMIYSYRFALPLQKVYIWILNPYQVSCSVVFFIAVVMNVFLLIEINIDLDTCAIWDRECLRSEHDHLHRVTDAKYLHQIMSSTSAILVGVFL